MGLGSLNPFRSSSPLNPSNIIESVGNIGQSVIDKVKDNPLEAAALVAAGYYFSPEISAWMNPSTGQAIAGTPGGVSAGASTISAEALAAANATADPLGALIAEQGWSVVDPAYLASIGLTEGMTPAVAAGVSKGLTFAQATDLAKAGLLVNAITGDPLGLGGGQPEQAAPKGFDIVPVPTDWKSPTYASTPVQNVSFEDLFPGVSLQGTQWAGLQNAQPNMSFNDIFASGLQSTPMGTPVNINDIVGNIIGQSAKS